MNSENEFLRNKRISFLRELPVFEIDKYGVTIEIYNLGKSYQYSSYHRITHKDFNNILKEIAYEDYDNIGEIRKFLSQGKHGIEIVYPKGIIKHEILDKDRKRLTEKVGGGNFPIIESIKVNGTTKEIKADYFSVYEIDYTTEKKDVTLEGLKIERVRKYKGLLHLNRKETDEYEEIPYLKEYLEGILTNWTAEDLEVYKKYGLEGLLENMKEYNHTDKFLEELGRSNKDKRSINWENV